VFGCGPLSFGFSFPHSSLCPMVVRHLLHGVPRHRVPVLRVVAAGGRGSSVGAVSASRYRAVSADRRPGGAGAVHGRRDAHRGSVAARYGAVSRRLYRVLPVPTRSQWICVSCRVHHHCESNQGEDRRYRHHRVPVPLPLSLRDVPWSLSPLCLSRTHARVHRFHVLLSSLCGRFLRLGAPVSLAQLHPLVC
jgi:hypothetical protein